jgi:hypothetical protein
MMDPAAILHSAVNNEEPALSNPQMWTNNAVNFITAAALETPDNLAKVIPIRTPNLNDPL